MITDSQKARMVELYASGESTPKIGRLFQLSPGTVNYWLRRSGVTLRGPRETSTRCRVRHDAFDKLSRIQLTGLGSCSRRFSQQLRTIGEC
jgi:transposase-like protein